MIGRRFWFATVIAGLAFGAALLPSYGHGDIDQQFDGGFTSGAPLSNPSSLSQSFTPGEATLVAVDLFLTTESATTTVPIEVTLNVRSATVAGVLGSVLGSATATVPSGASAAVLTPYVAHMDFSPSVTLSPGTQYVLQIEPVADLFWAISSNGGYPGGNTFIGTSSYPTFDFGFRTYVTATVIDDTPPVITYDLEPDLPANGWYRSDVGLDWTVTEEESEVTLTGCDDETVTADQDLTTYSCAASSAGGSAGPVSVEFGRDTVAPQIGAGIKSGTAGLNGWYRGDVVVEFTCSDDRSGIPPEACPEDETLDEEGSAISSTARTVIDAAGNESEPSNVVTVSIDKTPPVVTIAPDREPDSGGAYESSVTFTASGDDGPAGSGILSCDEPETYDGPASESAFVTMLCIDVAGNSDTATYSFVFVDPPADTTPPTIVASISAGTEGANGWYVTDVTVHFTCSDEESGIPEGNCPDDEVLPGDGAAISSTARTVLDAAGNESAPSNVVTVNIDTTKPVVEASPAPAPNDAGWNSTPVTVTFSATDSTSGVATCDPPEVLSADGSGQSATGSCTDVAGNTASATAIGINIDRTAPAVTVTPARPPDTASGYDHAIEFTASGDDGSGSGIAHCDAPETYSGPVAALVTVELSCTDNAGNIGSEGVTFAYVDPTPPVIGFTLTPPPPAGGWYTSDVTLTWTVTEAESPESLVTTGCADQHVTADQAFTTYSCSATSAGGTASVIEVGFARDATRPVIEAALTGLEGANGWFTGDVQVAFSCTDAGSGVATDTLVDATITTEGADQSATSGGGCVDRAGNAAEALTVTGIDLDKSGPSADLAVLSGTLGLGGWYVSNVVVRATGSDGVSGPVSCTADQTLSADALAHVVEASCTNAAGLETDAEPLTVKLDRTPPALAPALSATEVGVGETLSVTPNATDGTSGVASSSCGAIDTASLGARTVTCTAKDVAGNTGSTSVEYEVISALGAIVYGFRPPAGGGYGTFSFGGGTFGQLLAASGCPLGTSAFFFNKSDGTFAVWIPGAQVAVVNAEILALFAGTPPLPDGVIFTARCA